MVKKKTTSRVQSDQEVVTIYCHWRESIYSMYEGVSKSFRTGRMERDLQMVQLLVTRCSYIAVL
jgi:hypothetical protein